MTKFEITLLTNKNSPYLDTINDWMYELWGAEEGWDMDKINHYMQRFISAKTIPKTIIATTDGKIVGICNLLMHDLDTRPDLYPWAGNLFIDENYRGQGISTLLMNELIGQAKKLGLKELYSYTKQTSLCEKFGFKFLEETETFNKPNAIERLYKLDLIS